MYHISNDKRSKQSANLIYNGLLQCLKKKSFDQITVTDVQKNSGVARTTIYRCFDNLSDILYWKCDLSFQEALYYNQSNKTQNEWELIQNYFTYWTKHSEILKLLIDINRQDTIYACHMKNANILEKSYGTLPELDEVNAQYFMSICTGVTISILKTWITNEQKETTKELLNIIKKQLVYLSKSLT